MDESRYPLVNDQDDLLDGIGEEGLTKLEILEMLAEELGYALVERA